MGKKENTTTEITQFTKEEIKGYNTLVGFVSKEYGKVESSTLNIAFALHKIYMENLYKIDGYKNIYECGADKFNLARGTVSNFINVVQKFGKADEDGNIFNGKDGKLEEEFEKYSWSKLCLLVSVPDEYLDEFSSTMSCKDIREMKVEIAKRIETDEAGMFDAEEIPMNHPTEECEDMVDAEEMGETEVIPTQEMFLSVASFKRDKTLSEAFNIEELAKALVERWAQYEKTLPVGSMPTVEFGMIIR